VNIFQKFFFTDFIVGAYRGAITQLQPAYCRRSTAFVASLYVDLGQLGAGSHFYHHFVNNEGSNVLVAQVTV
jgi:hypothetical protein